jgi:hypothetical protein
VTNLEWNCTVSGVSSEYRLRPGLPGSSRRGEALPRGPGGTMRTRLAQFATPREIPC